MKLFLGLTIAALTLAGAGFAQTPPPDRPGRGDGAPRRPRVNRDQDAPRRGEAREDGARRQDPLAMIERAAKQLELDEAQQTKFDEIIAKHREEFEKNAETMRELMQQMRAARDAGDDAKAAEIRRQIGELRGPGQVEAVLDEVEAILTDAQKEKLGQIRERMERAGQRPGGPGGPGGPGDPVERLEQLRERLKLDETQTGKFNELLGTFREAIKPADGQPDPMRLQREMRQAVANGDRERAAEIRKQLDEHRQIVQTAAEELFTKLEPVLNDQQRQMVDDARQMIARGPGGPDGARGGGRQNDARMLIRAAKRLELTEEQKTQVDAIEKDAMGKIREAGRDAEPEALAAIKADVEKQIRDVLTSDQVEQFDQIVERLSNAGRGGAGRGGEGDPPRRRRPAPPPSEKP